MRRCFAWRTLWEVVLIAEMCVLASSSFASVFAPSVVQWRLAAVALVALAPGVALRMRSQRPPVWATLAASVVAYLLALSALAFGDVAFARVVPSPGVIRGLAEAASNGPQLILTSLVPAPSSGEMLAVPLTLLFLTVAVTTELTWRTRARLTQLGCVIALAVLGWSFGPVDGSAQLMLAAGLAALAILFLASRNKGRELPSEEQPVERRSAAAEASSTTSFRRDATSAGIAAAGACAIALLGLLVGAALPNRNDRFALRDYFTPPLEQSAPIDPLRLVPLARRGEAGSAKVLTVRIDGKAGETVRLPVARLDKFTCSGRFEQSGGFLAASDQLPPLATAVEPSIVEVDGYTSELPTLPIPGAVRAVAIEDGQQVYFDSANRMVALAGAPLSPVSYRAEAAIAPDITADSDVAISIDPTVSQSLDECGVSTKYDLESPLREAGLWASDASAAQQLAGLAAWCGQLIHDPTLPGGVTELGDLFSSADGAATGIPVAASGVGAADQLIAMCGILAQQLGLPARLVVGYVQQLDDNGEKSVTPNDLWTWLEVRDDDGLWHPIEMLPVTDTPDAPVSTTTTSTTTPPPGGAASTTTTTLPPVLPPVSETGTPPSRLGVGVAALLAVAAAIGGVWLALATRGRRRRSRRQRGAPADRLTGAWMETVDTLAEVGIQGENLAPGELRLLGVTDLPESAECLDQLAGLFSTIFAPVDVTDERADRAWLHVSELRASLDERRRRTRGRRSARVRRALHRSEGPHAQEAGDERAAEEGATAGAGR